MKVAKIRFEIAVFGRLVFLMAITGFSFADSRNSQTNDTLIFIRYFFPTSIIIEGLAKTSMVVKTHQRGAHA